jgi:hypothetical protein
VIFNTGLGTHHFAKSASLQANQLTVAGRKQDRSDTEYLYQGIFGAFVRAALQSRRLYRGRQRELRKRPLAPQPGRRVPEQMKPRKIAIRNVRQIEAKGSGKAG